MKAEYILVKKAVESCDAQIVSLHYYKHIFGNIVMQVECGGRMHDFVTDRGEIYHNNSLVCDNSYHRPGENDTWEKLAEIIPEILCKE